MKLLLSLFLVLFPGPKDPDPLRFSNEIDAFKKEDMADPPGKDVILFVGSSSIRMWKSLDEDFPEYNVLNRGFGGSHISDVIYFFDDVVKNYQPKKIIFYEGDNDLASGKSPDRVLRDFEKFRTMVRSDLPNTPIAVIAAKPSPSRWNIRDQYEQYNKLLSGYCEENDDLTFINVYNPMLNKGGVPEPKLFREDSLHMTDKGYKIWQKLVLPFVRE